jgi:hypothetical protein
MAHFLSPKKKRRKVRRFVRISRMSVLLRATKRTVIVDS